MGKARSRQPADGARAKRRSLVDLTAAVSRTIDESFLETPPDPVAVPRGDGLRSERAARAARKKPARKVPAETTVPAAIDNVATCSFTKVELGSTQFQSASNTSALAVEIAKEMQTHALEAMKLGVHTAFEYTKDIASQESDVLDGAAAECHAVVLELMKVNAGATLQYTRELSRVRTLSQWVELSSSHARKQCELVRQQAELLKSLTRNARTSGAD
ncbi:phasin family protein [Bradyrhizobium sp. DASA03007]|uniref:phasin family protein n=1 Tax=unclassified Bradyrhizobium TaxID=2631580 RepID=UPI003F709319